MKNEDLHNLLIENKNRNNFYKKETILIGFMILSIFLFLFGYFKWENLISLTFFCLSIITVTLILHNLFKKRESKYFNLINQFLTEQEKSISSEIRKKSQDSLTEIEAHIASEELIFEKKVANVVMQDYSITYEPASPFNSPISKILKERADERRKRMKHFNYEFSKSIKLLDEIERLPAYKRISAQIGERENENHLIFTKSAESYLAVFSITYIDHICQLYNHQKIDKEHFRMMYIIYYDYLKKNHPTLTKSIDRKLTNKADNLISRILNE